MEVEWRDGGSWAVINGASTALQLLEVGAQLSRAPHAHSKCVPHLATDVPKKTVGVCNWGSLNDDHLCAVINISHVVTNT
jgi:hypothetical protein